LAKHVVVEFVLNDIMGMSMSGFNQQNVTFGLEIEKTNESFRLTLDDCHEIGGTIEPKDISIRLTPGKPEDA
jgi:hypothetical protein